MHSPFDLHKPIAIGTSGIAGTVRLSTALATAGGVSVNFGTLQLNSALTADLAVNGSSIASASAASTITGSVNYTSSASSASST